MVQTAGLKQTQFLIGWAWPERSPMKMCERAVTMHKTAECVCPGEAIPQVLRQCHRSGAAALPARQCRADSPDGGRPGAGPGLGTPKNCVCLPRLDPQRQSPDFGQSKPVKKQIRISLRKSHQPPRPLHDITLSILASTSPIPSTSPHHFTLSIPVSDSQRIDLKSHNDLQFMHHLCRCINKSLIASPPR